MHGYQLTGLVGVLGRVIAVLSSVVVIARSSVLLFVWPAGQQVIILNDSQQYVPGVCWDPLGKVVVSLSNDRYIHVHILCVRKSQL